ncbi:right-handed parallel beta-helix repeat-containing protein [Mucilaginibacter sp.]|uniref:right-handed parallel beta-helix repeat-containing protein n=1 Tax=Mucilaginibacter sp. TaxID=1882438 RepID=UPI00285051F4|nr:right-handed parallel beta-helix repeat-containing protein [Mucilaginibacter sp.]MDR3693744.1 right-handed parallel beta-helix repeat-containing protein [Mucilaginibacter sp.]
MKTKRFSFWIASMALVAAMASCSKTESTSVVKPVIPPSHPITAGNISGFVKGTLLSGSTYTVTADINVNKGDTLLAQPGAIIVVKNNSQFKIQGVFQSMGTQASPVSFNSDSNTPGTWGGFACDSAQAVTIQWTKIFNTGGPDKTGSARRTLVVAMPIKVDIEDSWIENGQDDGLGLFGGAQVTILRNTIQSGGSTDGEAINLKTGATGTVAYNVIFSQAGTGVKLETAAVVTTASTNVDVYNNTIVSCGWRRGAAEPGRGVSAGVSAKGNVYNNIIVNCYHGLEIFTDDGTGNVKYGNNLFYSTALTFVDKTVTPNITYALRAGYYPAGALGVPQTSDIISTAVGNGDPMFVSFDGSFLNPNGAPNNNDFHLKAGSPAIGKGNATYNADMGAYTSDGKGNKH